MMFILLEKKWVQLLYSLDFVFSYVRERETLTHSMRSNIACVSILFFSVEFAYILDSLGFNVKAGYQGSTSKLWVPFPRQAADRK
nr:glutamyl-tRNA reductase-binding protein, chloroplastic isoform X1 [Ipomoea batatas]